MNTPVKFVQETSRLVRVTRFGLVDCFLVHEDDGLTLVDTGLSGSAPPIFATAQRLGSPLRRIVLTHAHMDHIGRDGRSLRFGVSSVREAATLRRIKGDGVRHNRAA